MIKEVSVPVAFPLQPVKVYPVFAVAVIVTEVPCSYSPPEVLTLPPVPAVTDKVYEGVVDSVVDPVEPPPVDWVFSEKLAVSVVSWVIVMVLLCSVDPSDQLENEYPELGVAVIVTWVPSSYVPPVDETDPPAPAFTAKV